jgi:hypothetical protein
LRARLGEFCGVAPGITLLWPRWLVLRAVGLVFVVVFAGILDEAQVLIGPRGLIPISWFLEQHRQAFPHALEAFVRAPGLFWLSSGTAMINGVGGLGLLAALALVLNVAPRLALFTCWIALLSFVTAWGLFSGSQVDQLMLETALLCLPFAPAGLRPGLGERTPPRPLAVFMLRWLLFRIMFEAGIVKLLSGEPRWWNFTAMDVLYETSPLPTILGYHLHQLPHAFHVLEILVTFAAELAAPLLAVFGGRRGRWIAFATWTVFQTGIHLTNNFGWLNTASLGVGLLLLDDQMLAALAHRLSLPRLAALFTPAVTAPSPLPRWRRAVLHGCLWLHFALTIYFFVVLCRIPTDRAPLSWLQPVRTVFEPLRSANAYTLYATLLPAHYGVEFTGSNDGGVTWRTYDYRYLPQSEDRMSPFIAPRYARFEQTLQIESTRDTPSPLYPVVATHLLQRDSAVIARFARDPFPDRPPTLIRMPGYKFNFTDSATRARNGKFWRKTYEGDYQPLMGLNARGEIETAATPFDQVRMFAEHGNAPAQDRLGFMYANGDGVARDPAAAARWYRAAATQGFTAAQFTLGLIYAEGDGVPRDEVEALVWFDLAARAGDAEAVKNRAIARQRIGPAGIAAADLRIEKILRDLAARSKRP